MDMIGPGDLVFPEDYETAYADAGAEYAEEMAEADAALRFAMEAGRAGVRVTGSTLGDDQC